MVSLDRKLADAKPCLVADFEHRLANEFATRPVAHLPDVLAQSRRDVHWEPTRQLGPRAVGDAARTRHCALAARPLAFATVSSEPKSQLLGPPARSRLSRS